MKRKTLALLLSAMLAVQPTSVVLAEDLLSSGTESEENGLQSEPQAAALTDGSGEPGTDVAAEGRAGNLVATGVCGAEGENLIWTLDTDGLLTISGNGEMSSEWPFTDIKNQIRRIEVGEGVTNIGNSVFYEYPNLESITLPEGLSRIDGYAFYGCTNLKSVTLPESIQEIDRTAFSDGIVYTVYIGTYGEKYAAAKSDSTVIRLCSADNHMMADDSVKTEAGFGTDGIMWQRCSNTGTSSADGSSVQCEYTSERAFPAVSSQITYVKEFTYSGNPVRPAVTVKDTNGNTLTNGTDYTVAYPAASTDAGDYTFTVTLKGNYTGEITGSYSIKKADQTAPSAPEWSESSENSVTLKKIAGTGNGTVQYAYAAENEISAEADIETILANRWSENLEITGLNPGTEYTFYARYVGDNNYNPSPASVGMTAYTLPTITTEILSEGTFETSYEAVLAATAAEGTAVTWSLKEGSALPTGLTLNGNKITGTPTKAETKTFTVQAMITADGRNYVSEQELVLKIKKASADVSLKVKNGEKETNEFAYGDTITVEGEVSAASVKTRMAEPKKNQAALFLKNGETEIQLTDAAPVTDGTFTLTYDTKNNGIVPSQTEQTLVVKYGGSGNLKTGSQKVNITLKKAQQTDFVIADAGNKTYGDEAFDLTAAGGQTDGEITWSVPTNNGVLALNGNRATILGAGKVTVTARRAGDDYYEDAIANMRITVAKKEVIVKAEDKYVEQDGVMPEFTYTISGLVNGDTVQKQPEFTCEAKDTKTAGEFDITPVNTVLANGNNYTVKHVEGTLTVNAHKWHASYTVDKYATCVTDGYKSIYCSNPGCHAVKPGSQTTIYATGHRWDKGVITKEPTCTEKGIRTCTCANCKWTLQKEVEPKGHTYEGDITKATFEKDGVVSGVCKDCGDKVQREAIPQVTKIELSNTEYTYNGTNRQPKVVLKDRNGKELKAEEYSVVYPKESRRPGTYEVTITLKGNYYEGSLTKEYTVKKGNQVIGLEDMTKRIDSKTVTLKAQILQGNKTGRFGYKSSNPEVASVTSWGRVTFHKVGKAEITAMTRGSANYNGAQKTITLTVAPAPTAITKLQSQNPGWLNIQYRANPDADGYQIQYGTSPDMRGAKYAAVEDAAIRSYTRKDVKSRETYYIRVRAYNVVDGERIYSNWSGIKSADVK